MKSHFQITYDFQYNIAVKIFNQLHFIKCGTSGTGEMALQIRATCGYVTGQGHTWHWVDDSKTVALLI